VFTLKPKSCKQHGDKSEGSHSHKQQDDLLEPQLAEVGLVRLADEP